MRIDSSYSYQNPNHFSTWKKKKDSSEKEKEKEKEKENGEGAKRYLYHSFLPSKTSQIEVDQPDGSKVLLVTVTAPGESRLCRSIRIVDESEMKNTVPVTHIHPAIERLSLLNEAL